MEEIRESQKLSVEPVGTPPNDTVQETVEQKEFGEEYEIAFIMADLLAEYINENGAILNNQAKKRVYTPAEVNPSKGDKAKLKELIEGGHTKFNKMDNFRTLYYIGDIMQGYESRMDRRVVDWITQGVSRVFVFANNYYGWAIGLRAKIDTGADRCSIDVGLAVWD